MWIDIDELRSELERRMKEAEEEGRKTDNFIASLMAMGEVIGYHKILKMVNESEEGCRKQRTEGKDEE